MLGVDALEPGSFKTGLDLDLPAAKLAEMQSEAANEVVCDLAAWFIMQTAKVVMHVGDENIPERDRAIIRRFWFQRQTRVQVTGKNGFIVLSPPSERGARITDFELKVA